MSEADELARLQAESEVAAREAAAQDEAASARTVLSTIDFSKYDFAASHPPEAPGGGEAAPAPPAPAPEGAPPIVPAPATTAWIRLLSSSRALEWYAILGAALLGLLLALSLHAFVERAERPVLQGVR